MKFILAIPQLGKSSFLPLTSYIVAGHHLVRPGLNVRVFLNGMNDRRFRRSLALALAEAKLGFSDLFSGLFSVLDINPIDGPGTSEGPK